MRSARRAARLALGLGLALAAPARADALLPIYFEANHGQAEAAVRFLAHAPGYRLYLAPGEARFALPRRDAQPHVLRMTLAGAAPDPAMSGVDAYPGTANYYRGADPAQWRTGVPTYARVRYRGVYPGIDLVYYGTQRSLEHDFLVAPGADPAQILLQFAGAQPPQIDAAGDLVLRSDAGDLRLRKPVIYQEVDGERRAIDGGYVLRDGGRVGFEIAPYDAARALVIDPVLVYSTYHGGAGDDQGQAITLDLVGHAYLAGSAEDDAFVAKFDLLGATLVYAARLGGSGSDGAAAIAVDARGSAYVTGSTDSPDFPVSAGAPQPAAGGGGDAFVAKLERSGTRLAYSTYLGGSGADAGAGIALDRRGHAYVTGRTRSLDFPITAAALQRAAGGCSALYPYWCDAFVVRLSAAGDAFAYATYLGGSDADLGHAIAVDRDGYAYVTGATASADFPTTAGAFQGTSAGPQAAFVAKLAPGGGGLAYATYLGGGQRDAGWAIAVDGARHAYVAGVTSAENFPATAGAFQPQIGRTADGELTGAADAFVAKLDRAGTGLVYATFLGGGGDDYAAGIAVDRYGNAHVAGSTDRQLGGNFPVTADAFQPAHRGGFGPSGSGQDAFYAQLDARGAGLVYSTYVGGGGNDRAQAVAVDLAGNAYLAGSTNSTDFPASAGAAQPAHGSPGFERFPPWDAFVVKLGASWRSAWRAWFAGRAWRRAE